MILYKYVPFETGRKILEGEHILFSQPQYFNDPFDMPISPRRTLGGAGQFSEIIRRVAEDSTWSRSTGVLSLTRTPTNPLMWAHYADSHRGMVIGIDVITAGLTDEATNLIPAQYGSVVYVSRRPSDPFVGGDTGLSPDQTHQFMPKQFEKLQRLFLHKSVYWAYEEEVRVVKSIAGLSPSTPTNASGNFTVATAANPSRALFLFQLPHGSIREVYFGFRSGDDSYAPEEVYAQVRSRPDVMVFQCALNSDALSVALDQFVPMADIEEAVFRTD